jgi:hypothetical protein
MPTPSSDLHVREAAPHHPDDGEVALRAAHALGASWNVELCAGRNELGGEFLASSVDELQKTAHGSLVRFYGHGDSLSILILCETWVRLMRPVFRDWALRSHKVWINAATAEVGTDI